jgi:hypothetical protein
MDRWTRTPGGGRAEAPNSEGWPVLPLLLPGLPAEAHAAWRVQRGGGNSRRVRLSLNTTSGAGARVKQVYYTCRLGWERNPACVPEFSYLFSVSIYDHMMSLPAGRTPHYWPVLNRPPCAGRCAASRRSPLRFARGFFAITRAPDLARRLGRNRRGGCGRGVEGRVGVEVAPAASRKAAAT